MLPTASGRWSYRVVLISLLLVLGLLVPQPSAQADEEPTPDATVGLWVSIPFGGPGFSYGGLPAGLTPDGAGNIVGIPAEASEGLIFATSPPRCETDENGNTICSQFSVALFLVVADSALRGTLTALAGNGQTAAPGQSFGTALTARLVDGNGVVAPSTEVTFTVTEGSAAFATGSTATARTNADGIAAAPALVAGSTAGPVLVTVSQPGSTSAAYMLNVADPGPARADLSVSLQTPSSVASGSTFAVALTVRNRGPSTATRSLAALVLPPGLSVRDAGGGTSAGPVLYWSLGTLAANSTSTRTATVKAARGLRGDKLLAAGAVSATRDPRPQDNFALRVLRVR
jgi:hypothetical protein